MHAIVIGGGEVGYTIAAQLAAEKANVVLIESDEQRCQYVRERLDVSVLQGNGASPRLLQQAGIDDANVLFAVANSDETNLLSCRVGSLLNASVRRVARVRNHDLIEHLRHFGAATHGVDQVLNLDEETVAGIMNLLEIPTADSIRIFADGRIRLAGFRVEDHAPIVGMTLIEAAKNFDLYNFLIVSIERDNRLIIPRGADRILKGDFLWVVAEKGHLHALSGALGKTLHPLRSVVIVGSSSVARGLAGELENRHVPCKMIVSDRDRAEQLAGELGDAVIIHGSGIDLELLREEGVADASSFVAVSEVDEDNILSSMLAKREGVPKVVCLLDRREYEKVITSVGVSALVPKNIAAANLVLGLVRKGKILSSSVLGTEAEVIEYSAMETSAIVSAPLKDIRFPKGSLLGAIVRDGEVIIPTGTVQVRPGDRVLIFTLRGAVKQVEKLVTVGLGFF